MIGSRIISPDAVTVLVGQSDTAGETPLDEWRASENQALYLTFDDGAGVQIGRDGTATPDEPIGEYTANTSGCCYSYRSRVPERFWLTGRGGERLCTFRLDETTRTEAPPYTRWAW